MRRVPALVAMAAVLAGAPEPSQDYLVFVASEAVDSIAVVRFGPRGITRERGLYLGLALTEQMGPHGLAMSPDGKRYFVTTTHGTPNGHLRRFDAATDSYQGSVELGVFPATAQVSPDGHYVYVANFNLWGEAVPSSISIVAAEAMAEVARVDTCVMPHGSRFTRDGRKHYSTCMMSDALVEIDTRAMAVSRHFLLASGKEMAMTGPPRFGTGAAGAMTGHGHESTPADGSCQPTWAQPSSDGSRIWVACSKSNELVEIDGKAWAVRRRIAAASGIYNLGMTHDDRLVIATNRRDQSVSVFDAASGRELKRIPTSRKLVSGVAVSDDDRYAFVTAEGTAGAVSEQGSLDVIDLAVLAKVATIFLGPQAGAVDFWKREPGGR